MSKKELIDLTPPQDMIYFMLKYSFFHKQVIQIPASVIFRKKVDFDLMKKALNIEIQRNDCMRLRFKKQGGKIKQYFIDEYTLDDIPVETFKTAEEQESCLTADAQKTIRFLKDETYRFIFFNSYDGRQGIYINVCHLVMDAAAVFIFFSDLFAVYDSLEQGADLPKPLSKYEDMIKREFDYINNSGKVERDKEFYTEFFKKDGPPIFNAVHGPARLLKAREKDPGKRVLASFDPIHDKAVLSKNPVSKEDSAAILDYIDKTGCSPECLVQLGMRLYLAQLNKSVNDGIIDTYFITLCTRRKTLADKRCGGTATNTLPWRIVLDPNLTFAQAIGKIEEMQHEIFRHQDYPFVKWRDLEGELFNYGMADGASTMMYSWFPLNADSMNGWDYEFTGYCMGRYVMPLYTYSFRDYKNNTLRLAYLYRTNQISQDNIDSLSNNTVKALNIGCKNPDITIKEICDQLV